MPEATRIRATSSGGMTEVRLLVSHVMETGRRLDATGARVAAWFVTELTVHHADRQVLSSQFGTAVAKNPYLVFRFKGGAPGETIRVAWRDNRGEARSDQAMIA